MTNHTLASPARGAMGGQKGCRINLETAGGIACNIWRRHQADHVAMAAHQQATHFLIGPGSGGIEQKLPLTA